MIKIAFLPVEWLLPYWSVQSNLSLKSYPGCSCCCLKELLRVKCWTWHCWFRCRHNVWRKTGFPKFWRRWERTNGIPGQIVQFQKALWCGNCLLLFWIKVIAPYLSRLSAFKGLKLKCAVSEFLHLWLQLAAPSTRACGFMRRARLKFFAILKEKLFVNLGRLNKLFWSDAFRVVVLPPLRKQQTGVIKAEISTLMGVLGEASYGNYSPQDTLL